ncbi:MAG: hypothetical protein RLY30_464 [Pseudomonadota bacterium]|jgi:2-dehydro-3-deoxygluconokinase
MTLSSSARRSFHIVSVGECMMELSGQALGPDLSPLKQGFGGDAFNTGYYIARLSPSDWKISFASAVGKDDLSGRLLAHWIQAGISVDLVRKIEGRTVALYLVETDAEGERHFTFWRSQSAARCYFDVTETPLETSAKGTADQVDILYFTGITLAILNESARERLFSVAGEVRSRGGLVMFDNNYRPSLWKDVNDARSWIFRAIAQADTAFITLDDHMALSETGQQVNQSDAIQHVVSIGARHTVIKRGRHPALAFEGEHLRAEVPVQEVSRVVDTTAAGDSFAAGYILAFGHGHDFATRLRWGNRLAANVIQHPGAIVPVDRDLLIR